MNIKISKGIFQFNPSGTGKFEANQINECCKGFFILNNDNTRQYINNIQDHTTIKSTIKLKKLNIKI